MLNLILQFTAFCRASELKVSTSEVIDCCRHLEILNVTDEGEFKAALKTNFVKSQRDRTHFDRLYDIFFHDLKPDDERDEPLLNQHDMRKEILETIAPEGSDENRDVILDFLAGDPIPFLEKLRQIQQQDQIQNPVVKSNLGMLSGRLEMMLQINQIRSRTLHLLEQKKGEWSGRARQSAGRYIDKRLETAFSLLTEEKKPDNEGLKQVRSVKNSGEGIGDKFFSSLTPKEIAEMRMVIAQLVRKLKDIISRRWAGRSRGVLDVKRTLRRAGRYQGVPIEVVYRHKPPRKGKIVTLCDISGSVWSAARFMLNMIYSLQDCFTQVRSFVFVSELAEVTPIFEHNEINSAVEKVMTDTGINYQALTDYGETFVQFKKRYLEVLTKKTTLIIVGDGRSNYFSPREDVLDEMREKSRRVIWLNPEPEEFWSSGDSEMNTYKNYCHEVRPCQTLHQLEEFISELIL